MKVRNLPHELILKLYQSYYSDDPSTDITGLLKTFNAATTERSRAIQVKHILTVLEDKKYIIWNLLRRNNENEKFVWHESFKVDFATDNRGGFYDLNNTLIKAMLSPDGVDYAMDIDRKRLQDTTNKLAILFAGLTVFISLMSFFNTKMSDRADKYTLQEFQKQLQSSDSLQRIHQNQMNYILYEMKKDSVIISKLSGL